MVRCAWVADVGTRRQPCTRLKRTHVPRSQDGSRTGGFQPPPSPLRTLPAPSRDRRTLRAPTPLSPWQSHTERSELPLPARPLQRLAEPAPGHAAVGRPLWSRLLAAGVLGGGRQRPVHRQFTQSWALRRAADALGGVSPGGPGKRPRSTRCGRERGEPQPTLHPRALYHPADGRQGCVQTQPRESSSRAPPPRGLPRGTCRSWRGMVGSSGKATRRGWASARQVTH